MDLSVYATAMSDEEMIAYTNINVSVPDGEGSSQENIFAATKSRYYRIPALMTLKDGGLMAAVDARFGSAGDSPNNLDTAVVFRPAGIQLLYPDYSENHLRCQILRQQLPLIRRLSMSLKQEYDSIWTSLRRKYFLVTIPHHQALKH